jgi:toxoflavin biosynthesis protein ToxC
VHTINVSPETPVATGHKSPVTCLEYSPDGTRLATGSYDGTVKLWEQGDSSLALAVTIKHTRLVNGVRWSPDGSLVATASADKTCRIWSGISGEPVALLARHCDDVNSMAWSPDGRRLATVSEDGTGRLWNVDDGTIASGLLTHEDHVMSVDWNQRLDIIATCGEDSTVRLWSAEGKSVAVWPQEADLEACRWSPDGTRLAIACDDGVVRILDHAGNVVVTSAGMGAAVKSVSWSRDARQLVLGVYDGTARVVDAASGRELDTLTAARLWPRAVSWNHRTDQIAVGTFDGQPEIFTARTRPYELARCWTPVNRHRKPTHGINDLAVAQDGTVLLASDDGEIHTVSWDGEAGAGRVRGFGRQADDSSSLLNTVAMSGPLGLVAGGAFSGQVTIWEHDGTVLGGLDVGGPVNKVAWHPSRPVVAIADYSGTVTMAEVRDGRVIKGDSAPIHDGAIKGLCWYDEDTYVTGATDHLVKIVTAGLEVLETFAGHGNLIDAVDVSGGPRKLIASTSRDHTIRIWRAGQATPEHVLIGHDESLKSVAWQPGSDTVLLTGSYDFEARIWDLSGAGVYVSDSRVLSHHDHGIGAVGWADRDPVTASWDTGCFRWSSADLTPIARAYIAA